MTAAWVAAFLILALVVLILGLLQLGFLRRATAVLEGAELVLQGFASAKPEVGGLEAGSAVPEFEVEDEAGAIVRFSDLEGEEAIYLFMDSDCGPCEDLARELARADEPLSGPRVIAIFDVPQDDRTIPLPRTVRVLYQRNDAASHAFETSATPHAFAVDARGVVVAQTVPNALEHLEELARTLDDDARSEPRMRGDGLRVQ